MNQYINLVNLNIKMVRHLKLKGNNLKLLEWLFHLISTRILNIRFESKAPVAFVSRQFGILEIDGYKSVARLTIEIVFRFHTNLQLWKLLTHPLLLTSLHISCKQALESETHLLEGPSTLK